MSSSSNKIMGCVPINIMMSHIKEPNLTLNQQMRAIPRGDEIATTATGGEETTPTLQVEPPKKKGKQPIWRMIFLTIQGCMMWPCSIDPSRKLWTISN